jgi:hypothetical protein
VDGKKNGDATLDKRHVSSILKAASLHQRGIRLVTSTGVTSSTDCVCRLRPQLASTFVGTFNGHSITAIHQEQIGQDAIGPYEGGNNDVAASISSYPLLQQS